MARCIKCNEIYSDFYLTNGVCENCITNGSVPITKENEDYKSVIITTENSLNINIEDRITIISAQRIFGINIVKDLFSFVRDIVGGRVNSLEEALNDATEQIFNEFKQKAYKLGGNAVIGIKIEHTYNNANSGSILSVFATGTVVKLANNKGNEYDV